MKPTCTCAQVVCLLGTILFTIATFIALTVGYILPLVHSKEFQPRACSVLSTQITHPFTWLGYAYLEFDGFSKLVFILESNSQSIVADFLHERYPVGTNNVPCYVSNDDIVITIDVSALGLAMTGVCCIITILFLAIFIAITIRQKLRRINYVELDDRTTIIKQPASL